MQYILTFDFYFDRTEHEHRNSSFHLFYSTLKSKTGGIGRLRIEYFVTSRQIHGNIGHKNGKKEQTQTAKIADTKIQVRFLPIEILRIFVTALFHVELSHHQTYNNEKKDIMKIIVVYHEADSIFYESLMLMMRKHPDAEVIVADAGEGAPKRKEITVPLPTRKISAITSKYTAAAIRDLRELFRAEKPDVVFAPSSSGLSNTLFALNGIFKTVTGAGKAVPYPAVVGYRGTQARVRPLDPTYRIALTNPHVTHVICETDDIAELLSKHIPVRKLSVHPKPYDLDWAKDAVAKPARLEGEGMQISYVGITEGRPHKGLHFLLTAMRILNERGVKTHLTVVGQAGKEDIASAPENVTFTGNRNDALTFIAASDVFVLPSLRDASPRVVREAEACGIPVVVSDIPGARDLVVNSGDGQCGILIEPANPDAIADSVEKLAKDPALRKKWGENGRRNIAEKYCPDHYAEYFYNLFSSLGKHDEKQ